MKSRACSMRLGCGCNSCFNSGCNSPRNFSRPAVESLEGRLLFSSTDIIIGPKVYCSATDQPQLSAIMYDASGTINDSTGTPMVFDAYIDTGASGFVISSLTANGYDTVDPIFGDVTHVPGLDIGTTHGTIIGSYTDGGIGGPETGNVTSPLGVRVRNGTPLVATIDMDTLEMVNPPIIPSEFADYGSFDLWVRRQEGYGERPMVEGLDLGMVEPMNVIGMPVISQSILVMDPTTLGFDEEALSVIRMDNQLLPKGSAVPETNMAFKLRLQDYVGTAKPGETLPSVSTNPVFDHVSISNTDDLGVVHTLTDNTWLFDTGSTSSMISFDKAKQLGLIDSSYATMADYMAEFSGTVMSVGGIGSITEAVDAPVLSLPEIRIADTAGQDVVWQNVDVLVVDVAGLDGVFGLNLLLPASTIDIASLTELGNNLGYFDKIVFDAHSDNTADLKLMYSGSSVVNPPVDPPPIDPPPIDPPPIDPPPVDPPPSPLIEVPLDIRGRGQFTDQSGNVVKVSLTGGGTGTLYFATAGNCDLAKITLSGTTVKSALTITAVGRGETTSVGGIEVGGPIRSISAATTDLSGDVTIGQAPTASSTATLKFEKIADARIVSQMPLRSLTAVQWLDTDATADLLDAPWVGSITASGRKGTSKTAAIRGDFQADLHLSDAGVKSTLGKAAIAGDLSAGLWDVTGKIGSLSVKGTIDGAAADDRFTVRGSAGIASISAGACEYADFLAGIREADVDEVLTHAAGAGDFASLTAAIGSIRINGLPVAKGAAIPRFLTDSNFSASHVGAVKFANVELGAAPAAAFGVFAGQIRSVKWRDSLFADSEHNGSWTPASGDLNTAPGRVFTIQLV